MNALEHALALAAQGIPVFPCLANKRPACHAGFKDASRDPATIRTLFATPTAELIGVPTGAASGLDVLDLDPRHGSDSWWEEHSECIPPTRAHQTRSGGTHLLFKHRPGVRCSAGAIAPGVDVRADGGYVVWHPASGLPILSDRDPAPWPAWLLAGLDTRPARTPEPGDLARLAAPSAAAVVELLNRLPNPASAGRDTYARVMLAAAGCVQALNTDDDGAIADAAVGWAERWDGYDGADERAKWEADWSNRPAKAGWPTLLNVAGELMPGWGFGPLPALPPARPRKLFVSRDFKIDAHQAYVIKHLVAPGNVCALLGQPGAGKSTLAPHLAYAVAQGRPVFGLRTTAGRTLYIAAEDLKGIQKRIGALGARHGHTDDCAVVESGNLREPDARVELAATVAEFKPALIVLDTVAAAFAGMDENTSQDMGAVVDFARKLAATGAAVLLVHHPAKQGDGSPRGHSVLNGTLDMVLTLVPDDVTDPAAIVRGHTPKNRNGTTGREFAFRKDVLTLGTDHEGDPVTTTLPVELDAADGAAKPVKLSRAEAAAMGVLHALLDSKGADQVPEAVWQEACAPLSQAEKPRDQLRSARNVQAKLVEKGAIHIVNGMVLVVAPVQVAGLAVCGVGSTQGVEFVDGIKWDQNGITMDQPTRDVGWMGSSPKGDPIPSHAHTSAHERADA